MKHLREIGNKREGLPATANTTIEYSNPLAKLISPLTNSNFLESVDYGNNTLDYIGGKLQAFRL